MNTFNVNSGKIIASDPCYKEQIWCNYVIENARNGQWVASVDFEGSPLHLRPIRLYLVHSDITKVDVLNKPWDLIGWGGVDSGQFGFFDSDERLEKREQDDEVWENWYTKCCDITLSDDSYGANDDIGGVVSRTFYGDGSYPVSVIRNENGEAIALMVNFDPYEDEDEDYDEEEEFEDDL